MTDYSFLKHVLGFLTKVPPVTRGILSIVDVDGGLLWTLTAATRQVDLMSHDLSIF